MKLFSSWYFYSIQNVVKLGLLNLTRVLCCSQYRKDTEPFYNYFMFSLISHFVFLCIANQAKHFHFLSHYWVRLNDIYRIVHLLSLSRTLTKNDNFLNIFRIEYMSSINPKKFIVQTIWAIYRFPQEFDRDQVPLTFFRVLKSRNIFSPSVDQTW